MRKDTIGINKKRIVVTWIVIVILAITSLVIMEGVTLTAENKAMAYKNSEVLLSEIEQTIAGNEKDKANLEDFLKDTYLDKARTVSYMLDANPELEGDSASLEELATTIGVDEIHIFDRSGTIYNGSIPKYFGLNMDAGDQIGYFKPMLRDHSLGLSQNVTPNTAEGRRMLYAMCWNQAGTRMIQVGADGERFPRILNRNEIDTIISMIPADGGRDIFLTQVSGDVIIASTNQAMIGKKLEDADIHFAKHPYEGRMDFYSSSKTHPAYCSVHDYSSYRIVIAQYRSAVNKNLPLTLVTFTEYLILVFISMSYVLDFMYSKFLREKNFALKDKLTDLYNRRAYENMLAEYMNKPMEDELVFVSMDVNGLKNINDRLGHDAGDRLLQGAAMCIEQCFKPYGEVFRFGGDEFAALIFTDRIEDAPIREQLDKMLWRWSEENGIGLHMSVGFARKEDYPQADIYELAKIADQIMYDAKAAFYAQQGYDRRGTCHESE